MSYGNHGRYLKIHLPGHQPEYGRIDAALQMEYIGGVGLGAWLLESLTAVGYDPLGPSAALVVALSPLVGTPLTTSAKFAIVAKSPLTGRICDAMCSSHFALAAKKLGLDAICIMGRCESAQILFIDSMETDDPIISFQDASELSGKSAAETENAVHDTYGKDWAVLAIGRAGELQIPYATISHDGRHAGRGGLGAVMGSKNLKAIAVRGRNRVAIADVERTMAIARSLSERSFSPATAKYRELGTVANLLLFNRIGALPTRNFQAGTFEYASMLAEEELGPSRKIARNSCVSCTIGCEHIYSLKSSHSKNSGVRMEYESMFALGPLLGISDPDAVLQASALCDELGLDTISTGGTIAFLMQCQEKGLLSDYENETGQAFQFGDAEAVSTFIRELASDQPGRLAALARLGSRAAAVKLGHGTIAFAAQVKGMEMPGYHPGRLHAMALGLAVGSRGADHNRSGAYEVDFQEHATDAESMAAAVIEVEDKAAVMDSMILCKFIRGVFHDFYGEAAEMLQAVTGLGFTTETLEKSAKAIVELRKRFNQREGWSPSEDTLPEMIFQDGTGKDQDAKKQALSRVQFNQMVRAYNQLRGWSVEGWIK